MVFNLSERHNETSQSGIWTKTMNTREGFSHVKKILRLSSSLIIYFPKPSLCNESYFIDKTYIKIEISLKIIHFLTRDESIPYEIFFHFVHI